MISKVYLVELNFRKPQNYGYHRLEKLWKAQKALAKLLGIEDSLHIESNRRNFVSYILDDDIIRFHCNTQESAIDAQRKFKALMKNRGYKLQ